MLTKGTNLSTSLQFLYTADQQRPSNSAKQLQNLEVGEVYHPYYLHLLF